MAVQWQIELKLITPERKVLKQFKKNKNINPNKQIGLQQMKKR